MAALNPYTQNKIIISSALGNIAIKKTVDLFFYYLPLLLSPLSVPLLSAWPHPS